jgi:hypothetical protein
MSSAGPTVPSASSSSGPIEGPTHGDTPRPSAVVTGTAPGASPPLQLSTILQPIVQEAVRSALQAFQSALPVSRPGSGPLQGVGPPVSVAPSLGSPGISGGGCSFPSFIPRVCLATGTMPTTAVSAGPIISATPWQLAASSASITPLTSLPPSTVPTDDPIAPYIASRQITPPKSHRPPFDAGPGRPPIPAKLVDQIKAGEYVEFADLLPDSLRDNEVPQELMLADQKVLIPKRTRKKEIKDFPSWLECWTAFVRVLLTFYPGRALEMIQYLDIILRSHRSFPDTEIWLVYDKNFRRKAACSLVKVDWSRTDMEVFHQAYASGLAPSYSAQRSGTMHSVASDALMRGQEAQGSPSGLEVCRTWNNGFCSSRFALCRRKHVCQDCGGLHRRGNCFRAAPDSRTRSRSPLRTRGPFLGR